MAHKPCACYSTKDCALFTSNKSEWKHIAALSWYNRQNWVTQGDIKYRVFPAQHPDCSGAPAAVLLLCACWREKQCLPAGHRALHLGETHKGWRDTYSVLEIRSQSKKMYVYAKSLTKFTCKLFSTYQRFQTSYFLLGLAQLLENMV